MLAGSAELFPAPGDSIFLRHCSVSPLYRSAAAAICDFAGDMAAGGVRVLSKYVDVLPRLHENAAKLLRYLLDVLDRPMLGNPLHQRLRVDARFFGHTFEERVDFDEDVVIKDLAHKGDCKDGLDPRRRIRNDRYGSCRCNGGNRRISNWPVAVP